MSVVIVSDGATVRKHPAAEKVYDFDWDTENLAVGATITTSTFAIAVLRGGNTIPLTKDNETKTARATQLRLLAGTPGTTYRITNTILDTENPTQTKAKYLDVLVQV